MTECRPGVAGVVMGLLLALPVMTGCSFSFSVGGIDYDALESDITEELNGQYDQISRQVSSVECPRQDGTPAAGESFVCEAQVDGNAVRVEVTARDDDGNLGFETLDLLYDGPATSDNLSQLLTDNYGFPVTVTCAEPLTVAGEGDSFDCTAVDPGGESRTVRVTSGGYGGSDRWEIVE